MTQQEILNIKAKSNGLTLIEHSKLVAKFAKTIAEKKYFTNDEILLSDIECAGLLHDIAKATDLNQSSINNNKKLSINPGHNEQAWAFLSKHLNGKNGRKSLDRVLYAIYWHHGISPGSLTKSTNDVLYNEINDDDKYKITTSIKELLKNNEHFSCSEEQNYKTRKSPKFYDDQESDDEINEINFFIRACLISADRMVSDFNSEMCTLFLENQMNVSDYIDNLVKIEHYTNINNIVYDNDRFKIQKNIVLQEEQTICFNAPAGFGKTNTGLFWITKNGEKTIWVCPRNTVAHSVYHSIIETFKEFGIKDITVELYLTGKVQKANFNFNNKSEGFQSDIIVTNIDNFLSPAVDNRNAKRLFLLTNSNVIFDEYHEYVNQENSILFSCFINIMKTRHRNTKSRTLLISATPVYGLEQKWNNNKQTLYLPDKYKHHIAAHDKKYKINVLNSVPSLKENTNSIVFLNAIASTQEYKQNHLDAELFHGDFERHIKEQKLEKIFQTNGKHSELSQNKRNVISTNSLQASADLSFYNLFDSIVSPMSTLQRIGRTNRWGEVDFAEINIFNLTTKPETGIKTLLFKTEIAKKWFRFLQSFDGKLLTLNEIYEIYNSFYKENQKDIYNYIDICYQASIGVLPDAYPIQSNPDEQTEDLKVFKSDSNKIRATGKEIFCIFQIRNTNEFTEVFNKNIDFILKNKTPDETQKRLTVKVINLMRKNQDLRYDYSKVNLEYISKIEESAKYSNSPYIVFTHEYDPELGIVKKSN